MAIQISNGESTPALVFDLPYVDWYKVEQTKINNITETPVPTLTIQYRMAAIDPATGSFHYAGKVNIIIVNDYKQRAEIKIAQGNDDYVVAQQVSEKVIADILQDETKLGEAIVI